jgi:hypothetical protein
MITGLLLLMDLESRKLYSWVAQKGQNIFSSAHSKPYRSSPLRESEGKVREAWYRHWYVPTPTLLLWSVQFWGMAPSKPPFPKFYNRKGPEVQEGWKKTVAWPLIDNGMTTERERERESTCGDREGTYFQWGLKLELSRSHVLLQPPSQTPNQYLHTLQSDHFIDTFLSGPIQPIFHLRWVTKPCVL